MLYNEFRPKVFSDVVGQGHITEIIRNQVKSKNVAHAYLFNGPKGTGKTTLSKILAKAVNCLNPKDGEPCNECEMCKKIDEGSCLDVVEMDAASKRKIEDMRNIISSLNYPTSEAKFRVIILDEVHMLTQEAVNAFLKTLEEPPKNTIFILATTDPQKLPPTILSRCQRYNFRRVSQEDTFKRLKYVSTKSSIKIDSKSLQLISKVADGGMRDALSILDQVKDLNEISYKNVAELLGTSGNENMFKLSLDIFNKDISKGLSLINEIDTAGIDFNVFIKDYVKFLRHILMAKVMGEKSSSVIPMTDEDISRLFKISASKGDIIRIIELFQKIDTRDRVSLELSVIKSANIINVKGTSTGEISEGKTRDLPQKNMNSKKTIDNEQNTKTEINSDKKPQAKTNNSDNTDTVPIDSKKEFNLKKEKIVNAKKEMIVKFNKHHKYVKLGQAVSSAKIHLIYLDDNKVMEIKITPKNEGDKKILIWGYGWIKKGFFEFSKIENLKITIENGGAANERQ